MRVTHDVDGNVEKAAPIKVAITTTARHRTQTKLLLARPANSRSRRRECATSDMAWGKGDRR